MDTPGALTKAECEMIVVVASNATRYQERVVAHGSILRVGTKNPLGADRVGVNCPKADTTPRQKAMLDFVGSVALDAYAVGDDHAALAQGGFDKAGA